MEGIIPSANTCVDWPILTSARQPLPLISYLTTTLQVIFNTNIAFQDVNTDSSVAETHKDSWKKILKIYLNILVLQSAVSKKHIDFIKPWDQIPPVCVPCYQITGTIHSHLPRLTSDWFPPASPRVLLVPECSSRHCPAGWIGLPCLEANVPPGARCCASWLWKQKKSQSRSSAHCTWWSVNNIYTSIPYSHAWHLMANFPLLINSKRDHP